MSDTFLPRLETDPDEPPTLIGWHMVKERPQTAVVFVEKDPS